MHHTTPSTSIRPFGVRLVACCVLAAAAFAAGACSGGPLGIGGKEETPRALTEEELAGRLARVSEAFARTAQSAADATTTSASYTSSGGKASPAGEAVPRFPPNVPRFRICGEPTVRDASARAGSTDATPFPIASA